MANIESLKILNEKLSLYISSQYDDLSKEIKAITTLHASKGLRKSGATITKVMDVCTNILEDRADRTISAIKELPFDYQKTLDKELREIVHSHFPDDLSKLSDYLKKIIILVGNDGLDDKVIGEIKIKNTNIVKRVDNQLDEYIIILKKSMKLSRVDKLMLVIELLFLLAITYVACRWYSDPKGNYEPYIIILGIITPIFEIGRRLLKKQHNKSVQ